MSKKGIGISILLLIFAVFFGDSLLYDLRLSSICKKSTGVFAYQPQDLHDPIVIPSSNLSKDFHEREKILNDYMAISANYLISTSYFKSHYESDSRISIVSKIGPVYMKTVSFFDKEKDVTIGRYSSVYTKGGWVSRLVSLGNSRSECYFHNGKMERGNNKVHGVGWDAIFAETKKN